MRTLYARIDEAENCVRRVREVVHGMYIGADKRTRLSLSCLGIAQDHHYSMVLCSKNDAISSCCVLARALFEALIRGGWLAYCASDCDIRKFIGGRKPPRNGDLIAMLEATKPFRDGLLMRIRINRWRAMCDYSHTGILAVQRYNTEEDVGPSYTDEEVIELLCFSNFFGILAATIAAEFVEDDKRANALLHIFHEVFPPGAEGGT